MLNRNIYINISKKYFICDCWMDWKISWAWCQLILHGPTAECYWFGTLWLDNAPVRQAVGLGHAHRITWCYFTDSRWIWKLSDHHHEKDKSPVDVPVCRFLLNVSSKQSQGGCSSMTNCRSRRRRLRRSFTKQTVSKNILFGVLWFSHLQSFFFSFITLDLIMYSIIFTWTM